MRKLLSGLVLTAAALLAGLFGLTTTASASTASAAAATHASAPMTAALGCHHCCGHDHNTNVNVNVNT